MVRRWVLGVGASLSIAALGCKPVCEEAGLRRAAAELAGGSPQRREAGVEALGEACPTLPSMLRWSLLAEHGELPEEQRQAVRLDQPNDSIWMDLLVQVCPRAAEPIERGVTQAEHDRAMRKRCELDRHGLLAPGDPFAMRDLPAFMLHEWLVSQRVDGALAREVVRPLLVAEASPAEREALCLRGELPCDEVLDAWGVRLPRSNGDLRVETPPTVRVTRSAIVLAGASVVPLHEGRPEPGAFADHVSPALLRGLETHPGARPGRPVLGEGREVAPLVIAADEATPLSTLVDVAFTASQRGLSSLELVARREHGLVRLPLGGPLPWIEVPEGVRLERALELTFVVHRDTVEATLSGMGPTSFPRRASCEPPPAGCHDHEAIGAYAQRIKQLFPHEITATFRVDGDVSLQAFVSLVDTVRGGERCAMAGALAGEPISEECLFWQAVVELEPPVVPRDEMGSRPGGDRG
jgi:hypothetical protein